MGFGFWYFIGCITMDAEVNEFRILYDVIVHILSVILRYYFKIGKIALNIYFQSFYQNVVSDKLDMLAVKNLSLLLKLDTFSPLTKQIQFYTVCI